jgi:hypothetical protein
LEPEEVYLLRLEEQQARVKAEGFDVMAYEPKDGETCEYSVQGKLRRRWAHFPCGEKPLVRLVFRGPQNPAGTPVVLCRRCVVRRANELTAYLAA